MATSKPTTEASREKARLKARAYRQSEHGKRVLADIRKKYRATAKGRAVHKAGVKKYMQTPNGKAADKRRMDRYMAGPGKLAHAELRRRNKVRLDAMKLENGCTDCGYKTHSAALHFDHLPGTDKLFTIGARVTSNWKKLLEEVAKCEVVCANCHAIRTVTRGQNRFRRQKVEKLAAIAAEKSRQLSLFD